MTQAAALQQARELRFDSWFRLRRWRVLSEVSGDREWPAEVKGDGLPQPGIIVHFDSGHFVIDQPGVFQTPLGHKGREGFLVRELEEDGTDLDGGATAAFGRRTLDHAVERYSAVSGLPA